MRVAIELLLPNSSSLTAYDELFFIIYCITYRRSVVTQSHMNNSVPDLYSVSVKVTRTVNVSTIVLWNAYTMLCISRKINVGFNNLVFFNTIIPRPYIDFIWNLLRIGGIICKVCCDHSILTVIAIIDSTPDFDLISRRRWTSQDLWAPGCGIYADSLVRLFQRNLN